MSTEWTKIEHPQGDIEWAGRVLAESNNANPAILEEALEVVNNWRLSHAYPLNTFQSTLRRKAQKFDPESLTAQRLKRLRAIQHKLQKRTQKPISLWEMQDIGGCRAVLKNVEQVKELKESYLSGDLKHRLVGVVDDYIASPRYSGYRGIHLIYSYNSDKTDSWNGLKTEIQMRTQLQHCWATAVEIVGLFRQELLKSNEGDHAWKQFFKLMASEIAMRENSPLVPNTPSRRAHLRSELQRCMTHIDALSHLHAFGQGMEDVQEVDTNRAHWFLLELDILRRRLKVTGYLLAAKNQASAEYSEIERSLLGSRRNDAVLVSVQSMQELKRAYTNYFFDMRVFTSVVEDTVGYLRPAKPVQLKFPFALPDEVIRAV